MLFEFPGKLLIVSDSTIKIVDDKKNPGSLISINHHTTSHFRHNSAKLPPSLGIFELYEKWYAIGWEILKVWLC